MSKKIQGLLFVAIVAVSMISVAECSGIILNNGKQSFGNLQGSKTSNLSPITKTVTSSGSIGGIVSSFGKGNNGINIPSIPSGHGKTETIVINKPSTPKPSVPSTPIVTKPTTPLIPTFPNLPGNSGSHENSGSHGNSGNSGNNGHFGNTGNLGNSGSSSWSVINNYQSNQQIVQIIAYLKTTVTVFSSATILKVERQPSAQNYRFLVEYPYAPGYKTRCEVVVAPEQKNGQKNGYQIVSNSYVDIPSFSNAKFSSQKSTKDVPYFNDFAPLLKESIGSKFPSNPSVLGVGVSYPYYSVDYRNNDKVLSAFFSYDPILRKVDLFDVKENSYDSYKKK